MFFLSTAEERQAHMKTKFHIKLMVEKPAQQWLQIMIEFANFLNDIQRLYQPRMLLLASQPVLPLFLHFSRVSGRIIERNLPLIFPL